MQIRSSAFLAPVSSLGNDAGAEADRKRLPAKLLDAMPRIVGGEETTIGQWPWQVAITANPGIFSGNGFERHLCGGSLVTPRLVVTAAHCFFDSLESSVYGFDDPGLFAGITGRTQLSSGTGQETDVSEYYFPIDGFGDPLYDPDTKVWDVVIVELASSSTSPTIKIAGPDEGALWEQGRTAFVTGWGLTSEGGSGSDSLRQVGVEMISDSICGSSGSNGANFIAETMVCAGLLEGGRDACQGDSGGPLVAPTAAGDFRLVGVTSKGVGCARPNFPGIYGRLAGNPIRSWLANGVQSIAGIDIVGSGARPPEVAAGSARIGSVTISGPARIRKGRTRTYTANISNSGDAEAFGVMLRVSGRGVRSSASVGSIDAGATRNVSIRVRPRTAGRVAVTFKLASDNAGGKTVRKTITVRR